MPARVSEADVKRLGRAARKQVARQPAPVVALSLAWRAEQHYERRPDGSCWYLRIRLKPEEIVQFDVMNLLRRVLPVGWIALHIANEAKRTRIAWVMQAAMGFVAGVPDIQILGSARSGVPQVGFVECKAEDAKLSPAQARFFLWADASGHRCTMVRSAFEMDQVGKGWGFWR